MSSSEPCRVIGILDDGWSGLSDSARAHLAAADMVIGAARTLQLVRDHLPANSECKDMDGVLAQVPSWVTAAREAGQCVALLATGDPLCHGIAAWLIDKLGREAVDVLPAPSTVQLAFARLKRPWADAVIASCHSADAGEWFVGATPTHGLYPALRAIARAPRVAVLTGPANTPARLARALITAGFEECTRISVVSRLCLPDEAVFADLSVTEAASMEFPEPNVAIVERTTMERQPTFGLDDLEYIQRTPEKGLITKQEARALSLAKLRLAPDAVVWDIGAGSGSVGLEAARLAPLGHVWAIEKNPDDAANARANAARFRVGNYTLLDGKAPEHLADWPAPDAVFIGGSGGELAALIGLILNRLKPGGRLVMN